MLTIKRNELKALNGGMLPPKFHPVKLAPDCGCNTTDEVLLDQIEHNIRLGIPQVQPHPPNDKYHALLVCGGPSLEATKHELVESYWAGNRVVAVNGAYEWCLQNNIKPSAVAMIDAREFNKRFIERDAPTCKYLLASQCHPATFELCRGRETYIWHALGSGSDSEFDLLSAYYFGKFFPITLGTTIGIRTISLLRMLGFTRIEIFGLDSCWMDGKHHAYAQEENDDQRIRVWLRAKNAAGIYVEDKSLQFECAPWHMKQADDFQQLIKERGDMFQLYVHGNGLLASMLRTGAAMQLDEERSASK